MNIELTERDRAAYLDAAVAQSMEDVRKEAIAAAALMAPLWPLKDFVAVNPALGRVGQRFEEAAAEISQTPGARFLPTRDYLHSALATEGITDAQLAGAIERHRLSDSWTPGSVRKALAQEPAPAVETWQTLSDIINMVTGNDWSSFAVDQISAWASAYYDEGQAAWTHPWKDQPAFAAWRAEARLDRTPEIAGTPNFRRLVAAMPEDPAAALAYIVRTLNISAEARPRYFYRLLTTISGWAGYVRYLGWSDELDGAAPSRLVDLLAIRAAFDCILHQALGTATSEAAWRDALKSYEAPKPIVDEAALIAQSALERSFQNDLVATMASGAQQPGTVSRPSAQAVFCIDVRSERFRRALESADPSIVTLGFAGFFGFAVSIKRAGDDAVTDQCPVLLKPAHEITETKTSESNAFTLTIKDRGIRAAWKRFKLGAVSSFAYVESWVPIFGWRILRDVAKRPERVTTPLGDLTSHMTLDEKIATASGALKAMSLNGELARLVALVGHGSTTTNNPYAAGLDCGACGGHTGEVNARIAAAVLNLPEVRTALADKGQALPEDTLFIAAQHDTTTDDVTVFDEASIPATHHAGLAKLKQSLGHAGATVRRERAITVGVDPTHAVDENINAKSRDWAEVRPEWGLAGCASFIVAPRERTRGLKLDGRAFLHNYTWQDDSESSVLELIMTAPLVVASWISLQYYGSTVDNQTYGSGDKTLHNVVGGLGILEGYGGDLRPGLPMQSVHDGQNFVHKPLRLTAVIEAPIDRIDAILAKHDGVRQLFENGWLYLIAIVDNGPTFMRRDRDGTWSEVAPTDGTAFANEAA